MSKKILVIEDEENLGKLIVAFLEKNGFKVQCLSQGVEDIEVIRKEQPDLILTDLLLPGLHGFDICKNVKEDPELGETPLIIMTAVYKNAIHKLEAKRLGVKDFVEKPLDFDDLLRKIEGCIGPAETGQKQSAPPPDTIPEDMVEISGDDEETRKIPIIKSNKALNDSIQREFNSLKENYADKLPEKVIALEKTWENILNGTDVSQHLVLLRRKVHSLTGSGETFGFKEISDKAREMELLLDMIIAEGEHTIPNRKNQMNGLLDDLRHHPVVSTELEMMRLGKTF